MNIRPLLSLRARTSHLRPKQRRRGFTFLEVLVALAIAMTFLGGVYVSFIQMLNASERTRLRIEGIRNARSAIMTMIDEIKAITTFSSSFLVGQNITTNFGDGMDNEDDGVIDEEIFNGRDDDNDWVAARDDRHARIATTSILYDRYQYTSFPPLGLYFGGGKADDLGDARVDEDVKFSKDILAFRLQPRVPVEDLLFRTITYRLGIIDNQPNVLVRVSRTEFTGDSQRFPLEETAPLAFGCVSLDFLYWDPNNDPNPPTIFNVNDRSRRPYWIESWNSFDQVDFEPPGLPLPASIFMMVTMYADTYPEIRYTGGRPIRTVRLPTMVNIEPIINNIFYPRPNL